MVRRVRSAHEYGLLSRTIMLIYSPSFSPLKLDWLGSPTVALGGDGPLARCKVWYSGLTGVYR
jgi:hypothetical protein